MSTKMAVGRLIKQPKKQTMGFFPAPVGLFPAAWSVIAGIGEGC
jgi:hypothetical protein